MTPKEIWNAAYNQLELQLDRASFNTWLRGAVFLNYKNGLYTVGVRNSYAQDMLQHRLYRNVRRVLSDTAGEQIEITFKVHKASPPSLLTTPDETAGSDDDRPLFRLLAAKQKAAEATDAVEASPALRELIATPRLPGLPDNDLNPQFTFDRYITSQSNSMVYEAARSISEYPGTVYNPFLIYGGVGLGKTHLLQAIAHECQSRGLAALYVPSEVFTNDLIKAIRERTTAMFREKYRTTDVLLMDDVQFIRGKESTQEEFFHTFNALVNFNKQIVLASDRHPDELKTLQDRLRSRFLGGLAIDVPTPELETRMAILKMWADERGVRLQDDVLYAVAEKAHNSVRDMKGMFNQLVAQTQLRSYRTVRLPDVAQTIERYSAPRERFSLDAIIKHTAEKSHLDISDITGKRRTGRINEARQIAMYLCRELTEYSLNQIGEAFGGRSHTTVLHGYNKITESINVDRAIATKVERIRETITKA
ncbi:MAG: chromosomal replication initiator protein DnaA [Aggregatilineales bacterium]